MVHKDKQTTSSYDHKTSDLFESTWRRSSPRTWIPVPTCFVSQHGTMLSLRNQKQQQTPCSRSFVLESTRGRRLFRSTARHQFEKMMIYNLKDFIIIEDYSQWFNNTDQQPPVSSSCGCCCFCRSRIARQHFLLTDNAQLTGNTNSVDNSRAINKHTPFYTLFNSYFFRYQLEYRFTFTCLVLFVLLSIATAGVVYLRHRLCRCGLFRRHLLIAPVSSQWSTKTIALCSMQRHLYNKS